VAAQQRGVVEGLLAALRGQNEYVRQGATKALGRLHAAGLRVFRTRFKWRAALVSELSADPE
jgi:hypothetical protein